MNPARYRNLLDLLLRDFVRDAYRLIHAAFAIGGTDDEIRARLAGPLHALIVAHRGQVWAIADGFVREQAIEQGVEGPVKVPQLRRYSERAVHTLLDERLDRRGRDDAPSVLGRDTKHANLLVQSAMRHVEAAGRSAVQDMAKELERERQRDRDRSDRGRTAAIDRDDDLIGTPAAAERQRAADARDIDDLRIDSTDEADQIDAPMWARVLTGADNCEFCVMLASRPGTSRGDFYTSQWAATFTDLGDKYHDHCDCVAVPIFNPRAWAGRRRAERIYELWKQATSTTSSRPHDKELTWDERVPALAEYREYMRHEAEEGRDPLAEIVGDLRIDDDPGFTDRDGRAHLDEILAAPLAADTDEIDWRARQDAIGVDFGDDRLEAHEIEFVEQFTALGHEIRWIPRDYEHNLPTNDFHWSDLGIDIEMKRTSPRYRAIHRLISGATKRADAAGVLKENFIIDLGAKPLDDRLRRQLEQYNVRNPHRPIARLFVFAAGVLTEIVLAVATR